MKLYHLLWLCTHPHRSNEWLCEKLKEGFDIHHIDGNKKNNMPSNLVLIESSDHMMLHSGGRRLRSIRSKQKKSRRGPQRKTLMKENEELKKRMFKSWCKENGY